MNDEPIKDLGTRAFQKRVLDEFAAIRSELSAVRDEQTQMRVEITEIRMQQAAMAKNIAKLDERLTTLEQKVDERLKETRPIWERVEEKLQRLGERFEGVALEFYENRSDMKIYGRRINQLERRVS